MIQADQILGSMDMDTLEPFTRHGLTHANEKPFKCITCGTCYRTMVALRLHARKHIATVRHVCPICMRNFVLISSWKNHMCTHTDERPYECSQCEKRFKKKGTLTVHIQEKETLTVHTQEKGTLTVRGAKLGKIQGGLQI